MIGPQPVLPARWLVALALLALPPAARDRYREEFRSELCELGAPAQLAQAAGLLAGAIPLRNALSERELPAAVVVDRRDWRCRIGRHRFVVRQDDNPEMRGRAYLRCTRCGKPKDPPSYGPAPMTTTGWAGPFPT